MSNAHKTGLTLTASASGAPTSTSAVKEYIVTAASIAIKDGSTAVTSNYNITAGTCKVTVTTRTVTLSWGTVT